MDHKYLLVINGKPQGPFTPDELKTKGIKPNDFVRADGMDDYKEAHEVPELRLLFGFHKQVTVPQYFGSFDQRLLASVIDWFLTAMCVSVLAVIVILLTDNASMRIIISLTLILVIPLTYIVYHMVMECSPRQATYGKQLLKIRVCDADGNRITPAKSIGRNLAKMLSVATLGVGYLLSFFNKKTAMPA